MSTERNTKRRRKMGPMIVGDVDSAQVVTPKRIYERKEDGTLTSTEVWQSLDPPAPLVTPVVKERSTFEYQPDDLRNPSPSPPPEGSYKPTARLLVH
jgi:hypothetical protein